MSPPDPYTPELAAEICARLAQGESLRAICRDERMPSRPTVTKWITEDRDDFAAQYTRARDTGLDMLADEAVEISDSPLEGIEVSDGPLGTTTKRGDMLGHRKLQVDTRKWYLSKLAPKRYGDRIAHEHTGADGGPIKSETVVDPSHRANLIADIAARLGGLAGAAESGVAPTSGTTA